jgi:hypothetical protein
LIVETSSVKLLALMSCLYEEKGFAGDARKQGVIALS